MGSRFDLEDSQVQFEEQQVKALLEQKMRLEAENAYPNEACGLIVGVGKKAHFVACRNISSEPRTRFQIDPADYARAEDMGEVLAIWHSHTDGNTTPSDADKAGAEATELPWLISGIVQNGVEFYHCGPRIHQPDGFEMPYIGRPYVFGIFDCYALVRDYYLREFGIKLALYPELHVEQWWKKGMNIFGDNFEAEGFVPVTDESWEEGDVLLFAVESDVPNHVAIYVTGDIILHHTINRLSRRETCGSFWSSKMTHHLRHKTRC